MKKEIVSYQPPGGGRWQPSEEVAKRARELLKEGVEFGRLATAVVKRRQIDAVAFERDLAAGLGAWDRFISAEAKVLEAQAAAALDGFLRRSGIKKDD